MLKHLKGYVEAVEKSEEGTLAVAVASDDSVDRDGDRIDAKGWDFSDFERNPVLLFAHNYREEPIGKVVSIVKEGNRILFRPQFAVGISERAKRIFELYKAGVMNAFSVGFIPMEWKDEKAADGSTVRTFTRTKLLEISAVPVPANPNALVLARSMGADEDMLKALEKGMKDAEPEAAATEPVPAPVAGAEGGEGAGAQPAPVEPAAGESGGGEPTPEEAKAAKLKADIMEDVSVAIKDATEKLKTDLLDEVHKTMRSLAEKNGNDGNGKVEPDGGVATVDDLAKRVLQHIDKGIGAVLRDIKSRERER